MALKIIFGLLFSALGIFLLVRGLGSYENNVPQLIGGGVSLIVGIIIILAGGGQ